MKLTQTALRQIIKEELATRVLSEDWKQDIRSDDASYVRKLTEQMMSTMFEIMGIVKHYGLEGEVEGSYERLGMSLKKIADLIERD
jgi:hypothetical protein